MTTERLREAKERLKTAVTAAQGRKDSNDGTYFLLQGLTLALIEVLTMMEERA